MKKENLGHSDIQVSKICLGTMTWGEQNTQEQAFEQMDFALERGVNFFDTAELYPVPPNAKTYTSTETIIGNWFSERKQRDKVVLASKIAGPSPWQHIRDGKAWINKEQIETVLDQSLKRLQTDYIDLYQLHWPNRKTTFFGFPNYTHQPQKDDDNFLEVIETLSNLIQKGKIRTYGLSNETPWGTMKYLELAKENNLPAPVSIQNPYSLLNRTFESGLAEISMRENVKLLAYSPLGFGVLTGKYLGKQKPKGSRLDKFGGHFSRYTQETALLATTEYVELAKKREIKPSQFALSFVNGREFLCSNIIGATTIEQLEENISSIDTKLDTKTLKAINTVHTRYTNPCP